MGAAQPCISTYLCYARGPSLAQSLHGEECQNAMLMVEDRQLGCTVCRLSAWDDFKQAQDLVVSTN